MNRPLQMICLSLFALVLCFVTTAAAQGPEATLSVEEIKAQAEAQLAKIADIKATYDVSWKQVPAAPFPEESQLSFATEGYRVEIAVAGDKRKSIITHDHAGRAFQKPTSNTTVRTSFDGLYSLSLDGDMGNVQKGKSRQSEDVFYLTEFLQKPITDAAHLKESEFFPHYLASRKFPSRVLAQQEQLDGHWCHVVQSELFKVWVDPELGCLPRKIDRYAKAGSSDPVLFTTHLMKDYREVADGLSLPFDNTRVLYASVLNPEKYWNQPFLELNVKVQSASIDVEDSDFALEALPGTLIVSDTAQFTVPGDKTLILQKFGKFVGDEAAYRPGYRRWRTVFLGVNLVLLAVAAYLFVHRRKGSQTASRPSIKRVTR